MLFLGNEQRSLCRFWDCTQVLLLDSFVDYEGYFISSKGFLWLSELNLPILVHFISLIPRMSTFTLAISCLTTSNLPWFMDLTFHVPMQYCSLYHQIFLSPPGTSFVLWRSPFPLSGVSSLFFCRSISDTYQPGVLIFRCHIFLPFHTVHGALKARILEWFAIPFSSGPRSVHVPLDHGKSKRVPEKHLFLLYWLCQSLWLCGSQ